MADISVVIPAKNEEKTLPWVFRDLNETIEALQGYTFEVICVDDNSTDATAEIAQRYGAIQPADPAKALPCAWDLTLLMEISSS